MDDEKTEEIEFQKLQIKKPSQGNIRFYVSDDKEVLRFEPNGDIFVHEKLIENDRQIVDAFYEFLRHTGHIKSCVCIGPPASDCPIHGKQ